MTGIHSVFTLLAAASESPTAWWLWLAALVVVWAMARRGVRPALLGLSAAALLAAAVWRLAGQGEVSAQEGLMLALTVLVLVAALLRVRARRRGAQGTAERDEPDAGDGDPPGT